MVYRKHNTIRSYRRDGTHQIRSRKMSRSGQPDILLEVIPDRILHRQTLMPIMSNHPMIAAPEMTNDHLNAREAIEDTIHAYS